MNHHLPRNGWKPFLACVACLSLVLCVPEVRAVRFLVFAVDDTRYRVDVEMDVITYPFKSVPVDVAVLDNGEVAASTTVSVDACGKPPDQPCPGRATLYIDLPRGVHVLEVRARDHGDDKMYPDDFGGYFYAVSRYVREWGRRYVFYPVGYVWCLGEEDEPHVATREDVFLSHIKESGFWSLDWVELRAIRFETDRCVQDPTKTWCLRLVEWEGRFIYKFGIRRTTDELATKFKSYMHRQWEFDRAECRVCIDSVHIVVE